MRRYRPCRSPESVPGYIARCSPDERYPTNFLGRDRGRPVMQSVAIAAVFFLKRSGSGFNRKCGSRWSLHRHVLVMLLKFFGCSCSSSSKPPSTNTMRPVKRKVRKHPKCIVAAQKAYKVVHITASPPVATSKGRFGQVS